MDSDALSIGSSGSLIANLFLLAIFENVSAPPWWSRPYAPLPVETDSTTSTKLINTWRPFIDNAGWSGSRRTSCPEPRFTGTSATIAQAPLPPGYDPYAPLEQPFHACLRVAADGRILGTKLIGSSGSAETDGRILALIASRWRLDARGEQASAWLRVRLNAGPDEDEVLEPLGLY
ncbi:MAG TPA: hypothetical protein VF655_02465 [Allosphingosinicella sp.]|jgi:hypothetical protein